jgi:hypothetical protein
MKTVAELLAEQNELLAQQNATANGMSYREDMRGAARRWDEAHPVAKFFCKNPLEQWK